jgi:acetyl esterase/lipase
MCWKKISSLLLVLGLALGAHAQEKIWQGTSCKASQVTLTAYLPVGTPKAAVIICPGGSYHWLEPLAEGQLVGEWLQQQGYAAYVLRYRVAGKFEFVAKYRSFFRGNRHPDMICDLQRAIQLVRERYQGTVGVMGFSAGGHLAMSGAEFFDTNFLARYGIEPQVSLRPDFVAPIYPVVTLRDPRYVHRRSRLGLLSEPRVKNQALMDSLSLELHVKPNTPPVFLVSCQDDPVVDYHNALLLDSALTVKHIPHRHLQFETGGHGFGADPSRQNAETSTWQQAFVEWIKLLRLWI